MPFKNAIGFFVKSGGWSLAEVIIRSSNPFGWYIAGESSTITKNGSNQVSLWSDYIGGGNNLAQSGVDNLKPIANGTTVVFDGIDDFLTTGIKTQDQPVLIYAVVNQLTIAKAYQTWFSGMVLLTMYLPKYERGSR